MGSADTADLDAADGEFLARVCGRPPITELRRGHRIRVQRCVRIAFHQCRKTLEVDVVGVLVGDQNGVESGDALEAV